MFLRSLAQAPWIPLVTRVFLSLVFVISGFEKLQNFNTTVTTVGNLANPSVALALTVIVIVFELGGGLMLLANWNPEAALSMLVIFLIVATILVHGNLSDSSTAQMNIIQIEKNLAILGGLLLYARHTALEEESPQTLEEM